MPRHSKIIVLVTIIMFVEADDKNIILSTLPFLICFKILSVGLRPCNAQAGLRFSLWRSLQKKQSRTHSYEAGSRV